LDVSNGLADHRRRLIRLALLVGLLVVVGTAPAQNFDNVPRSYFNQKRFEIPFTMKPGRRVTQLRLHASTDGKVFHLVATASPTGRQVFEFTAQKNGMHYFVVQVEDDRKTLIPATVDSSVVDLQVLVDDEPPVIEKFEAVAPNAKEGTVAVEWSVKDNEQLNLDRLRVEYRKAGGKGRWTPVPVKPMNPAQVGWSPPEAGEYEVKLSAFDTVGNSASKETKVVAKEGKAGGGSPKAAPSDPSPEKCVHVREKKFRLNYSLDNVGPSQIQAVEIWMTQDTRQWSRHLSLPNATGRDGCELTMLAPGRYGFIVRPISGVLKAIPEPRPHDEPQIWVIVDETKPDVRITSVTPGEGEKKEGTITVKWVAKDKWLADKPITIKCAGSKDAKDEEWKLLGSQLEDKGSYEVPPETLKALLDGGLPYQFYVRVEAVDRAGNVGTDTTQDTVKVDTKVPKAVEIKVNGVSVGKRQ
jgi:hypothetical protein